MTDTQTNNGVNGNGAHNLFSAFGKLCIQLGETTKELRDHNRRLRDMDNTPVFAQTMDSGFVSGGFLVLRLQGPDQGDFWYIRRITVGGITPVTTAAGRADVFVSATDHRSKTALNQFNITDWRDQAVTLPLIATYGRGGLSMRFNEELYIAFSSATNGQQYYAMCQFEKYSELPVRSTTWVA